MIVKTKPLECHAYLLAQFLGQHLQLGEIKAIRQIHKSVSQSQKWVVINLATNPMTFLQRGLRALKDENYDEAMDNFTHALRLDPNCAVAYTGRAAAYLQKGDRRGSSQNYDQAISALHRMNPDTMA